MPRWSAALLCLGILATAGPRLLPADSFSFRGDRTQVILTEGRERTVLEGNATIESNDILLQASVIELFGSNFRFAELSGSVRVRDDARNLDISAGSLSFDRTTENSTARGDIVVADQDNDILLRGEFLETRDGGDVLLVQSSVRVFQEDLSARAQFLRYRRDTEVLELSGFPVVLWDGDQYRATRIVLDLAREEIELQGRVEGEISVEPGADEPGADEPTDGADTPIRTEFP